MGNEPEYRRLTREELNEFAGEELSERAAMLLISANVAVPIAANVLSDDSVDYANTQPGDVTQST